MKKSLFLFCVAVLFAACDSSMKEARQFAEELSAAINAGDTTTLSRIFPDAAKADSLALKYNADSLEVEPNAAGDTLTICFSKDVSIAAVKDADGKFRVSSSRGLFAYPDSILVFAKQTGWYDANLDDIQNAERLSDNHFISWLVGIAMKEMKAKVKIVKKDLAFGEKLDYYAHGCDYRCTHTVIVSNKNDADISGKDYYLSVVDKSNEPDYYQKNTKRVGGKDIPANGTVTLIWKDVHFDGTWIYEDDVILNYTPSLNNVFEKMNFTGKEYAEYLANKK